MKKIQTQIAGFLIAVLLIASQSTYANNIQVSNVKVKHIGTDGAVKHVTFNISWENGWRTDAGPENYDAAWIFIKYKLKQENFWNHASLAYNHAESTSPDENVSTVPSELKFSKDDSTTISATKVYYSHGVFLQLQSRKLQGKVEFQGVKLRWESGYDNLFPGDSVDVYVGAIEMVYIPEGSFNVGDGNNQGPNYERSFVEGGTTGPFQIQNSNAITLNNTAGNLWAQQTGFETGTLPAAYPNGFDAFYIMKYEVTQEQYVQFLNKLTSVQDANRFPDHPATPEYRQNIRGGSAGARAVAGGSPTTNFIPVCRLNYQDMIAYLDWTALRPMTELEYEKACRGPETPINGEFAWGTAGIANQIYTLSNTSEESEGIATNYSTVANIGNTVWSNTGGGTTGFSGPLRSGIFAANAGTNGRVSSGGSYYGVMELTGNVSEMVYCISKATARSYKGIHGDGKLSFSGNANVSDWALTNTQVNDTFGARGFWFSNSDSRYFTISSRVYCPLRLVSTSSSFDPNQNRGIHISVGGTGIRGVRTAK